MLVKIAWRSLWRNRRRTLISMVAIAFALGLTVFMVAFADGVYEQMIDDAVRVNGGHFTVENPQYHDAPAIDLVIDDVPALRQELEATPGVVATKALILGQAVVKSAQTASGVALMGVEPERERKTSPLAERIIRGQYLGAQDEAKVVLGKTLAERLKVSVGKKVVLTANDARGELVEELARVAGVFSLGSEDADAYMVQIPIGFARRLYGLGETQATQLGAVVVDSDARDRVLERARARLPASVAVRPWEEVLPDLASYVRIDRNSNLLLMGILVFLSLFTIYNTLAMTVLERTRELAILLALGTSPMRLRGQVLVETAFLGLLGCVAGLALGGAFAYWMQVQGLDLTALYGGQAAVSGFAIDPVVHARLTWKLMLQLGGLVLGATLGLGLIPLRHVGQIDVATVLR